MRNEDKYITEERLKYNKIGSIRCPALGGQMVYFNNKGFRHILKKKGHSRPMLEIRERLNHIGDAVRIVNTSNYISEYRELVHDDVVASFWQLNGTTSEGSIIKVIIRKVGIGSTHFFSVMKD